MNKPEITTQRQRDLLRTLIHQVDDWSRQEVHLKQERIERLAQEKAQFEQRRQELIDGFETQHGNLLATYKKAREGLLFNYSSSSHKLNKEEAELTEGKSEAMPRHSKMASRFGNTAANRSKATSMNKSPFRSKNALSLNSSAHSVMQKSKPL